MLLDKLVKNFSPHSTKLRKILFNYLPLCENYHQLLFFNSHTIFNISNMTIDIISTKQMLRTVKILKIIAMTTSLTVNKIIYKNSQQSHPNNQFCNKVYPGNSIRLLFSRGKSSSEKIVLNNTTGVLFFKSTSLNKLYQTSKRNYSRYSASTIMPHNTFNLNNYDIIGFDLDGTLLRYNLDAMVPMEYELICKFLVEKKKYPKELLRPMNEKDMDFMQKGLIIDGERGNILKFTADGVIAKATHGTKLLSVEQIKQIYGRNRKWDQFTSYMEDPLSAWNGPIIGKLRALLDFFDMPSSLVVARAVDIIDEQNKQNEFPISKIWPDVLDALIYMYNRENFANGISEYFEKLKKEPAKYIHKSDPFIIDWIKELKKTKAILLLTGSNIDFANFTASYALGHNWRDLFDIIVCFAKKPGFFTMQRPFYSYQGGIEDEIIPDNEIRMDNIYAQGNWKAVEALLAKKFDHVIKKPRSLYFGDNLIQDIYAPSRFCNLDTVSLIEELEEHECRDNYAFKKVIQSHFWDTYFSVDSKPTFWSDIIASHSKMCLPTIEHLCEHPIDYEHQRANSLADLCSSKIEN